MVAHPKGILERYFVIWIQVLLLSEIIPFPHSVLRTLQYTHNTVLSFAIGLILYLITLLHVEILQKPHEHQPSYQGISQFQNFGYGLLRIQCYFGSTY